MIETHGKLYDRCRRCGKLVRLNKPIFGAMHFCVTPEDVLDEVREETEEVRRVMRKALQIAGLPKGKDDDGHCSYDECGIRLGEWVFHWGEGERGSDNEFWLIHDSDGEMKISNATDRPKTLARRLKKELIKEKIWEELKDA
jgi:hypothetical protein